MNYIYDILINFKYPLLDFYEWNKTDDIKNIKKIPLYKVNSKTINDFKNNKIKVIDILNDINNLTLLYSNKKNRVIKYACILSDENEAIACMFNNKGILIGKSKLLLDEEQEVLFKIHSMEEIDINYEIISKDINDLYKTKKEIEMKKYILNEMNNIKDIDKLNYIYYAYFNRVSTNPKKHILLDLENNWDEVGEKIYQFLQNTSINKA